MSWQDVLKAPFMDNTRTSVKATGDWGYEKTGGTDENPIVFIKDVRPLNKEEWDAKYLTQYKSETTFFDAEEGIEISSYGRVKINGTVQRPEKSERSNKMVTKITGYKQSFRQNREGSAADPKLKFRGDGDKLRKIGVPYSVSINLMNQIEEEIPPNAELFVNGQSIGPYSQHKEKLMASINEPTQKEKPSGYQPVDQWLDEFRTSSEQRSPKETRGRKAPPARRGR